MNGYSFLQTARFLQSEGDNEAAFRSAISRAYYACFIGARDIVFRHSSDNARRFENISKEKDIRHVPLARYLRNGSDENVRQLGNDLAGLRGKREDADYNMFMKIDCVAAEKAIEEADAFLKTTFKIQSQDIAKALDEYVAKFKKPK